MGCTPSGILSFIYLFFNSIASTIQSSITCRYVRLMLFWYSWHFKPVNSLWSWFTRSQLKKPCNFYWFQISLVQEMLLLWTILLQLLSLQLVEEEEEEAFLWMCLTCRQQQQCWEVFPPSHLVLRRILKSKILLSTKLKQSCMFVGV